MDNKRDRDEIFTNLIKTLNRELESGKSEATTYRSWFYQALYNPTDFFEVVLTTYIKDPSTVFECQLVSTADRVAVFNDLYSRFIHLAHNHDGSSLLSDLLNKIKKNKTRYYQTTQFLKHRMQTVNIHFVDIRSSSELVGQWKNKFCVFNNIPVSKPMDQIHSVLLNDFYFLTDDHPPGQPTIHFLIDEDEFPLSPHNQPPYGKKQAVVTLDWLKAKSNRGEQWYDEDWFLGGVIFGAFDGDKTVLDNLSSNIINQLAHRKRCKRSKNKHEFGKTTGMSQIQPDQSGRIAPSKNLTAKGVQNQVCTKYPIHLYLADISLGSVYSRCRRLLGYCISTYTSSLSGVSTKVAFRSVRSELSTQGSKPYAVLWICYICICCLLSL